MPKLPTIDPKAKGNRAPVEGEAYAESIALVLTRGSGGRTKDLYRFGVAMRRWLEQNDEAKAAFLAWYEAL